MRSLVLESLLHPKVVNLATSIWYGSNKNHRSLIEKVDTFLRRNFMWKEDEVNGVPMEAIQTPEWMIEGREQTGYFVGDCDDISTLEASLLTVMGIQCRFVVIRSKPDTMVYDHVFVEALADGKWIVSDITVPKDTIHKYYQRLEIAI